MYVQTQYIHPNNYSSINAHLNHNLAHIHTLTLNLTFIQTPAITLPPTLNPGFIQKQPFH